MNPREYQVMFDAEDRHWWYRTLHALILHFVHAEFARKGPLEMLDVGCGTGGLMGRLAAFGRVAGCDISPDAVDFCRRRGLKDVVAADLLTAGFAAASYDVVTAIDVLCHGWMKNEREALAQLYAALRPGGMLITNDPAFECLRGTHDAAVFTKKRFRRKEFAAALGDAGFIVKRMTYRLFPLFLPVLAVRVAGRSKLRSGTPTGEIASDIAMPAPFVNAILYGIGRLENASLHRVSAPIGTSLFTVARKPG